MKLLVRVLVMIGLLSTLYISGTEASVVDGPNPEQPGSVFYDLARLEVRNGFLLKTLTERIDLPAFMERMQMRYELADGLSASDHERLRSSFLSVWRYAIQDLAPDSFWENHLAEYYALSVSSRDVQKILETYDNPEDSPARQQLTVLRDGFWDDIVPALFPEIRTWVGFFRIPSQGMSPTLLPGDEIVVNKLAYKERPLQRGDVIVFRFPEDETKPFVKRVIGIPGDVVELRKKVVYVNGQPLQEDSYVQHTEQNIIEAAVNPRDNLGVRTVPADSYFVLGDNRESSLDSRFWGYVKKDKVLGRVMNIYWSVDSGFKTPRLDRTGQQVH